MLLVPKVSPRTPPVVLHFDPPHPPTIPCPVLHNIYDNVISLVHKAVV